MIDECIALSYCLPLLPSKLLFLRAHYLIHFLLIYFYSVKVDDIYILSGSFN